MDNWSILTVTMADMAQPIKPIIGAISKGTDICSASQFPRSEAKNSVLTMRNSVFFHVNFKKFRFFPFTFFPHENNVFL